MVTPQRMIHFGTAVSNSFTFIGLDLYFVFFCHFNYQFQLIFH